MQSEHLAKRQKLGPNTALVPEQQALSSGQQVIHAVKALLQHEALKQQSAKSPDLKPLLLKLAGKLLDTADVLHASLQMNSLPAVPEFCKIPASAQYAEDIIAYGRRLSFTTFAPAGWTQGAPLGHFRPPAPQEHQLQASQLSRHAVEETAKSAAAAAAAAKQPAPKQALLSAPETKPAAGSALPRAAPAPITASGFHPKEPSTGFEDMPAMPEGWTPGDPIPDFVPDPSAKGPQEAMQQAEDALLQQQQPSASSEDEEASEPSAGAAAPSFPIGLSETARRIFEEGLADDSDDASESDSE